MEAQNTKQSEDYHLFYVSNRPQTLTIIKDKKSILGNLYSLASFFWIIPEKGKWATIQQQFQKQVGENLTCCLSVKQTKNQIKNKETVVIICQGFVLKNNIDIFQQEIASKKITHVICIGLPFQNKYNEISFVNNIQKVFVKISSNKFSYNKANNFINFIFVSKEIWDSSILVKTMFAMLQQETNRSQMLQYMGEVAQISCPTSKIGLVNQFVQKNKNPDKTSPIGWYTKQSFLYTFVNSILRLCKDPTALFVLQPYFKDLFYAIFQLYKKQQKIKEDSNHNYRSFYCYRGAAISEKEVQQFKSNINSVVENLGFLSTSFQIDIANGFVINVLYQIEVHDEMRHPQLDFGYAFVQKYSSKSGEQEIIFNPLNTFKILSVGEISDDIPIYFIRLKYGELARVSVCDDSLLSNQQMKYKILGQYRISERNKFKNIGDVLIGDFNLMGRASLEYSQKYLQIALESKNQPYISHGYEKLGKYYQNNAQSDKMIQNYEKILIFSKNQSQNDPSYCNSLCRLGAAYIGSREYGKAIEYLELGEKLTKKIHGPMSQHYIIVLNNLSAAYIRTGYCLKAQKWLNVVKKIQKEKYGQNNGVYLSILNNIGTVYYRFGLFAKAIQNFEKALYLEKTSLGENHPRCVKKYINLALAYFRSNQYAQALPLFLKAENIEKKYYSQNSQSYLTISKFTGIIYSKLNQFELSIHYFQKCKIFYEANPSSFIKEADYAQILFNLGEACIQLGKYDEAVEYLQKNLKIAKEIFGQQNSKYIKILISLGNGFIGLQQYEKALEIFIKAQILQKRFLGWDNWQYSLIMYGFGMINQKNGYFLMALSYLNMSKSIQKNIADQNFDKIYGKTLVQIGHLYMKFDEFQKAIENYYESLKYKKKIFGENHQQYATILNFIGQAYNNWGQLNNALKWFKPFQTAMKKIFGQSHPKYAESLNSLAMVHENLGQLQLAKELYGKSAVILSKELNQKDPLYQKTLGRLSLVLFNLGSFQQAMETCIKSGDAKLIEKMTSIFQKGNKINQIVSQFKSQTVLRLPLIKVILREIHQSVGNKNYSSAIRQVQWFRKVCGGADYQFHQELDKTEIQIYNKILSQVNNYYEIADHLEGIGHYEEAEHIYSWFILIKYKEVAFAIPEIFSFVEGELYSLKNKYKVKAEANDTHTEEQAKKYQFCYLDFQF